MTNFRPLPKPKKIVLKEEQVVEKEKKQEKEKEQKNDY